MNIIISSPPNELDPIQNSIIQKAGKGSIFLYGKSGSGKTATAHWYIKQLLHNGTNPGQILLLTPQRNYQNSYREFFSQKLSKPFTIQSATLSGLARKYLQIFWPLVLEDPLYPFEPKPPTFLTLETAQYYMMSIVKEKLNQGKFIDILLDPNRLTSQLLDNLNKSALVGFDPSTIESRLSSAWSGDRKYLRSYADMQETVIQFRELCFKNSLIDFSLQLEVFSKVIWRHPLANEKFFSDHRHLIIDHVEEDVPVAHDLMIEWIPKTESCLAIYNTDGGYRTMLGADPLSARRLSNLCSEQIELVLSKNRPKVIETIREKAEDLVQENLHTNFHEEIKSNFSDHFSIIYSKYFPGLIDQIAEKIYSLIKDEKVTPSDIAVLAPYVNDALTVTLGGRLEQRGLSFANLRPSRAIADNPYIRSILTIAKLCYPKFGLNVSRVEFSKALFVLFDGIDLIRATLISDIVLRANNELSEFSKINEKMRDRIGESNGKKFEYLRSWIEKQRIEEPYPLDILIRKAFGELLSTPGFSLAQPSTETANIANLIESIRKFRLTITPDQEIDPSINLWLAQEYIEWIEGGILAAAHRVQIESHGKDEIILMPATSFLMEGKSVKAQFWLDIGSPGWFERVDQPLTHPYVLSRNWDNEKKWTDTEEYNYNKIALARAIKGLLGLAADKVYFCYSQFGENGFEQNGMLLRVIQKLRN